MVDLNADGFSDLITGSDPGAIYVFEGRADRSLAEPVRLRDVRGDLLEVGRSTTARANDWDADGDLDLVIGDGSGQVWFVENESGGTGLAFGTVTRLEAGGVPIRAAGGFAAPWLADWDGDGTTDLLLGDGEGDVRLWPNLRAKGVPVLGESVLLAAPIADTRRAKPCVVDWNEDGRLDLVVGAGWSRRAKAPLSPDASSTSWRRLEEKLTWINERLDPLREHWARVVRRSMGIDERDAYWARRLSEADRQRFETRYEEALEKDVKAAALAQMLEIVEEELLEYLPSADIGGSVWVYLREAD